MEREGQVREGGMGQEWVGVSERRGKEERLWA